MLQGKKYLVVGLGRSGIAATEALLGLGAQVTIQDKKTEGELEPSLLQFLVEQNVICCFGKEPEANQKYDVVVMSPGAPLTLPFVQKAEANGAEVISEIELAYRLGRGNYIAITGTNGKTTTTTLTGEIFKKAGRKTEVVGNIGTAVVKKAVKATSDTWFVTEVSSFQLEAIKTFRPKVSALLNITPDHLDRHKTLECYAEVKAKVFMNQEACDYFVVNYDDELSREQGKNCKAKVIPFSRKEPLELGAFVENGKIVIKDEAGEKYEICGEAELVIPGTHNLENALAAAALSFFAGISAEVIGETLRTFQGVEHRLEYVTEVEGVRFVNDSKGTNPDAAIKALEAMKGNVLLIAGGYDKKSSYEEFIRAFDGKVKKLLLLGVTAPKIKETAISMGYPEADIVMCEDMDECVKTGYRFAERGDTVLLSPACASWGMYSCFEQRGEHFKNCIKDL